MPFLPGLSPDARVFDGFAAWPDVYGPMAQLSQSILRDARSNLSPGERELVGAYVSKLNRCSYCAEVHSSAVAAYGIDKELIAALVDDLDSAPVDERLRPILRFARKLTLDQHRMVQADTDAILAAGWSEEDVNLAVALTALFNFMNRFVHGLGIDEDPAYSLAAGPRLRDRGYGGSAAIPKAQRDAGN